MRMWTRRSAALKSSSRRMRGGRFAPALHMKADQGSIGWPALVWLRRKVGLRMTQTFDPHHRWQRDILGAVSHANLNGIRVDFGLVLNAALGPWSGDAHFGTIHGAAEQMKGEVDHTWVVFQMLYPEVCGEMGINSSIMGSHDHMKMVRAKVLECPMFKKTGMGVKFGRWFQFEDKSCEVFGHRMSFYLLLLLYVGSKKNWWRSLMDSPLFQAEQELQGDDAEGDGASGVGADGERQSVAQSNESLRKRRGSCKNSLHLTCRILGDRVIRRVHRGMVRLLGPVRKFHGESLVMGKTVAGCVNLKLDMARGEWHRVSAETFEMFLSASFAEELEFLDPERGPYEESEHAGDDMVLQALFSYLCENVGGTELTNMHYMAIPPYVLVGLVGKGVQRAATLAQLSGLWDIMCAFEEKMHEAPSLKRVHTDLVFLHDHWFRELMVPLHEVGFKEVPDFVYGAVHDFAKSWLGTKITEDAHNVLRDKIRHSKSNTMCPKERWHKCVASPLLQDCDRQEVSITGAAKQIVTKKVLEGTFEWVGTEKFSLGLDVLRALGDSNPSWPTMSPTTCREMPMAWKSVSSAAPEFAEVSNTWVALLLEPGHLVKIGDTYCGLAVAVTEWGFLCMKMFPTKTRGIGHVHLALDGQTAIVEHMSLTDISSVKVLNIMPASPARWSSDVQQASRCIVMRSDGGPSSLLKSVARNAFKNLTVPRLEMLASLLKVKFEANERRPRTLHD